MKLFRDATGAEWPIELTFGAVLRVKSLSDGAYDLLRPEKPITIDGLGSVVLQAAVAVDVETTYRVLCMVLDPLLRERGLDGATFAERIAGASLIEGRNALLSEWRDFFLQLQRPDQAKALEKMSEWLAASAKKLAQSMETLDLTRVDAEILRLMDSTLSRTSGEWAASSGSTHADSPGEIST